MTFIISITVGAFFIGMIAGMLLVLFIDYCDRTVHRG